MHLSPPHPLYPAQLRTGRADELIGTLRKQFQSWADAQADDPTLTLAEISPGEYRMSRANDPSVEDLLRAAITVGEVSYNCRAALDYVVAELAKAANGANPVAGTQFPIEDFGDMFEARITGRHLDGRRVPHYLNKVPAEAIEIIRDCQPFAGCEWTELLRDISNPDKHQFVAGISSDEDARDTMLDPSTGIVHGTMIIRIHFEHDPEIDVVAGLMEISSETAHLIEVLAPAFEPKRRWGRRS